MCNWLRCCRRNQPDQEWQTDLTQDIILDESIHESSVMINEMAEKRGPAKKRVVPNNNQDKWLIYLLNILNKSNDLPWVEELLSKIEES